MANGEAYKGAMVKVITKSLVCAVCVNPRVLILTTRGRKYETQPILDFKDGEHLQNESLYIYLTTLCRFAMKVACRKSITSYRQSHSQMV